jgi:hypothetical protein
MDEDMDIDKNLPKEEYINILKISINRYIQFCKLKHRKLFSK